MRFTASEKYELIQLVQDSDLSVRQTLKRLSIHRSTFYGWLKRYDEGGVEAWKDRKPEPTIFSSLFVNLYFHTKCRERVRPSKSPINIQNRFVIDIEKIINIF